jgi:hypothetical protein
MSVRPFIEFSLIPVLEGLGEVGGFKHGHLLWLRDGK